MSTKLHLHTISRAGPYNLSSLIVHLRIFLPVRQGKFLLISSQLNRVDHGTRSNPNSLERPCAIKLNALRQNERHCGPCFASVWNFNVTLIWRSQEEVWGLNRVLRETPLSPSRTLGSPILRFTIKMLRVPQRRLIRHLYTQRLILFGQNQLETFLFCFPRNVGKYDPLALADKISRVIDGLRQSLRNRQNMVKM